MEKPRKKDMSKARFGEANSQARLNEKNVSAIREMHEKKKATQKELAAMFNTTRQTINDIVRRRTWTHLE